MLVLNGLYAGVRNLGAIETVAQPMPIAVIYTTEQTLGVSV